MLGVRVMGVGVREEWLKLAEGVPGSIIEHKLNLYCLFWGILNKKMKKKYNQLSPTLPCQAEYIIENL